MRWSHRLVLSCVLGLLSLLCSRNSSAQQVPAGVKYDQNVVYGQVGDVQMHLDIARPEAEGSPRACIVMIHGGGWRGGKKSDLTQMVLQLAGEGYVATTIEYRMVPTFRFPAQVEDVKCAIRFLRAHAEEYNLDPQRIGAVGMSAGAHLAMLLGVMDKEDGFEGTGGSPDQSSKVQAVVAYFGPTDFTQTNLPAISQGLINDFVGFTREDNLDMHKAASPITYVDKNDAPILIFQGTKDRLIPTSQATVMADKMTQVGLNGRVELLINADHGWGGQELLRTIQATKEFLKEQLSK